MAELALRQAPAHVGVSRQIVNRLVQQGKLSATLAELLATFSVDGQLM